MAFQTDYSENGGGIIAPGVYECVIKAAYEDITKGGTPYISVPLVVRNDVEQSHKNGYIWHSIWKKKEPTDRDKAAGGYTAAMINRLSQAADLPEGSSYETLQDWMEALHSKLVRVTVSHELNAYNNQMRIKVDRTEKTKYPDCKHVWKSSEGNKTVAASRAGNSPASSTADAEGDDFDDLPF